MDDPTFAVIELYFSGTYIITKNFNQEKVTFFQRNYEKKATCGIVLASAINLLTTSSFIESDKKATFCKTEFFLK